MAVKYKLKNIGPIKEAELELGDLTIIAGENNTGKTYLTYALYGFLNMIAKGRHSGIYRARYPFRHINSVIDINIALVGSSNNMKETVAVTTYSELTKFIKKQIERLCYTYSRRDLHETFAMPEEQFINAKYECDLGKIDFPNGKIEIKRNTRVLKIDIDKDKDKVTITTRRLLDVKRIRDNRIMPLEREDIKGYISLEILNYAIEKYLPINFFIMPAERFGVSLFYKELDFTKSRLVEQLQLLNDNRNSKVIKNRIRYNEILDKYSSRYAQTIRDHIDFIRDIEFIQKEKSPLAVENKLSDGIKKMMEGYYRYANNEMQFISTAKKNKAFRIPLHVASSSAKGFAAFYFYLQHIAVKGQLLIIDEPESHLDTANQRKLARLLARCVNAGVKVFINTHSDYLVQELNNLIKLSVDFKGKDIFLKKFKHEKYTPDEFLNPQKVKGYICENGTLTPCKVDKYGIDMTNFDQTISDINKVSDTLDHLIGDYHAN